MNGRFLSEAVGFRTYDHFSLQVGKAENQINHKDFLKCGEWLQDWTDTAAAIENLDIIIAVDTAVAHLAGALPRVSPTKADQYVGDGRTVFADLL